MNIKATIALTALVLSTALTAPAFAQSGTITFKGRIVAPICSGTAVAEQANPSTQQSPAFSMDNSGCENSTGMVASTRVTRDVAPTQTLIRSQPNAEQASSEPVLTITYH